jgi:hypothetical protein
MDDDPQAWAGGPVLVPAATVEFFRLLPVAARLVQFVHCPSIPTRLDWELLWFHPAVFDPHS